MRGRCRPGGGRDRDRGLNNKSLYADEAIDTPAGRRQTVAIHRDRQRDRPFEAGATQGGASRVKVPIPAARLMASVGRWLRSALCCALATCELGGPVHFG
ncbi:hypothetical protein LC55x_1245 [Lysobacter capsici]|nr:hypothetical protein LC55x_1245 [Lysobacter capsici]